MCKIREKSTQLKLFFAFQKYPFICFEASGVAHYWRLNASLDGLCSHQYFNSSTLCAFKYLMTFFYRDIKTLQQSLLTNIFWQATWHYRMKSEKCFLLLSGCLHVMHRMNGHIIHILILCWKNKIIIKLSSLSL